MKQESSHPYEKWFRNGERPLIIHAPSIDIQDPKQTTAAIVERISFVDAKLLKLGFKNQIAGKALDEALRYGISAVHEQIKSISLESSDFEVLEAGLKQAVLRLLEERHELIIAALEIGNHQILKEVQSHGPTLLQQFEQSNHSILHQGFVLAQMQQSAIQLARIWQQTQNNPILFA